MDGKYGLAWKARQFRLHARQNQLVAEIAKSVVADYQQAFHDVGGLRQHILCSSTRNMK
jgi:hypothetical protein